MGKRLRWGMVVISLCFAGWGCAHRTMERPPRLKIAILPEYSLHLVSRRYHPLLEYLEQETGMQVEWVSASTWEGYPAAVERRRPHLAWQDSYMTYLLKRTQNARPLLQIKTPEGSLQEKGLVVVRADSRWQTLSDLRGRRVVVPSRRALLSGLAQTALCAEQGLLAGRDFACIVANRTDRALLWVLEGKADAAFVRATALERLPAGMGRESLRVVAETEPFPGDFIVAFPHTPPEWLKGIREALTALTPEHPKHAELLQQIAVGGFVSVEPPSFAVVQGLLERLAWPL